MGEMYENLYRCLKDVQKKIKFQPKVALILGSGLGGYGESIQIEEELPYGEIEGFPVSTIKGHKGRFLFGYEGEVPVAVMQGRVHYYEGYSMEEVVRPIRLLRLLGAETLFLTNASGGVNLDFKPGDLMVIRDQISSFVPSPLIGENEAALGNRFPDMSEIYSEAGRKLIKEKAKALGIPIKEGVYLQFTGPAYESPAEIRMARMLGADAVGMSTACEAVAARHMGMKVCGISCVTNMASGILKQPLCHEEVQKTADKAGEQFQKLVKATIQELGRREI